MFSIIWWDIGNIENEYKEKDRLLLNLAFYAVEDAVESVNVRTIKKDRKTSLRIKKIFARVLENPQIFGIALYEKRGNRIIVLYSLHRLMTYEMDVKDNPAEFEGYYEYPIQTVNKIKLKNNNESWIGIFPKAGRVETRQKEMAFQLGLVGLALMLIAILSSIILFQLFVKRPLKAIQATCKKSEENNYENPIKLRNEIQYIPITALLEKFRSTAYQYIIGFDKFNDRLKHIQDDTNEYQECDFFLSLALEASKTLGGEIFFTEIKNNIFRFCVSHGLPAHEMTPPDVDPVPMKIMDKLILDKDIVCHYPNQTEDSADNFTQILHPREAKKSLIYVPIFTGDHLIGVAKIVGKENKSDFTNGDKYFLLTLFQILGLKLRKIRSKNNVTKFKKYSEKMKTIVNKYSGIFKQTKTSIKEARDAANSAEWDEAILKLKNGIKQYHPIPEALKNIGIYYYKEAEYQKSIGFLTCAIELDDKNNKYFPMVVSALYRLKDYNSALHICEYALEKDPENQRLKSLQIAIQQKVKSFLKVKRLKNLFEDNNVNDISEENKIDEGLDEDLNNEIDKLINNDIDEVQTEEDNNSNIDNDSNDK